MLADGSDATPDVAQTYDAAGRLTSAASSVSTCAYGYDDAGQLLSETTAPAGLGTAYTLAYSYDLDGRRVWHPAGMRAF